METLEVRLYSERVGILTKLGASLLAFAYDTGYARTHTSAPLSTCLPLERTGHRPKRVTAWFEGLLKTTAARVHRRQRQRAQEHRGTARQRAAPRVARSVGMKNA